MFRRSPYLDQLPVLSLEPDQISQYKLRRSGRDDHFCTSEVAALCMNLAGERVAEQTLEAYLAVFTHHYLRAKNQQSIVWEGTAHQRLREVSLLLLPSRAATEARRDEPTVPPSSRAAVSGRFQTPGAACVT
jgi:hypothetical protein